MSSYLVIFSCNQGVSSPDALGVDNDDDGLGAKLSITKKDERREREKYGDGMSDTCEERVKMVD